MYIPPPIKVHNIPPDMECGMVHLNGEPCPYDGVKSKEYKDRQSINAIPIPYIAP